MEQFLVTLREIGLRKASGVVILACAALLFAGPGIVDSIEPWLWLAVSLAAAYLTVDVGEQLISSFRSWRKSKQPAPPPFDINRIDYDLMDAHERSVLRKFVDEHSQWIPLKSFDIREVEVARAIRRLIERQYLVEASINHISQIGLHELHWRKLIENPDYVGSDVKPKLFG